ncbi:hypothetical protein DRN52_03940 [Thermococci archaeon]|nr:MAG: hypothetical protein DRN52_03940 [Thermococci archaeon]
MVRKTGILSTTLLLLLLSSLLITVVEAGTERTIKAPAVRETEEGFEGVITEMTVRVEKGEGHVYVEIVPFSAVDTQVSAKLAVEVASRVAGVNPEDYDFFVTIRAESPVIGGPSAGAALTVATISALMNLKIREDVMITGTINPDGTIGPVGGILEKAEAAHRAGAKKFLVPEGQLVILQPFRRERRLGPLIEIVTETRKVNVAEYAKEKWGLEVIEVGDIYQAVEIMTGKKLREREIIKEKIEMKKEEREILKQKSMEMISEAKKSVRVAEKMAREIGDETLIQTVEEAKERLDKAEEEYSKGNYYSASSYSFQSKISSGFVRKLAEFWNEDPEIAIDEFLDEVDEELDSKERQIEDYTGFSSASAIEAYIAAEKRIEEAKETLKIARKNYYNEKYKEAIYSGVYALERGETAIWWLELAKRIGGGERHIDFSRLKEIAERRIAEAQTTLTYAQLMTRNGSEVLAMAKDKLESAKKELDRGKPGAALLDAIDARVQAAVVMEILGLEENEVEKRYERAKEEATIAISTARGEGVEPILAVSYYEYAESIKEENPVSSLVLMLTAAEIARTTKHLEETLTEKKTNRIVKEEEKEEEKRAEEEGRPEEIPGYTSMDVVMSAILGISILLLVRSRNRKFPPKISSSPTILCI